MCVCLIKTKSYQLRETISICKYFAVKRRVLGQCWPVSVFSLSYTHTHTHTLLQTPQSPVVRPAAYDIYGVDDYPLGTNAIVAVISYTVNTNHVCCVYSYTCAHTHTHTHTGIRHGRRNDLKQRLCRKRPSSCQRVQE